LIGLALGSVFTIFLFRGDRRLRRRDQMAEAVGAPIILSMNTAHRTRAREWIELFERHDSSANDRWRVRKTLRDLDVRDGVPATLVILTLNGDVGALAVAPQIALCA